MDWRSNGHDYDNQLSTARQLVDLNQTRPNATFPVAFIASGLRTLQGLQDKFIRRQIHASYLTMAVYEIMHEEVMITHREMMDTENPAKGKLVRDLHFNTFKELVRQWKPDVKAEDYASLLKVVNYQSN